MTDDTADVSYDRIYDAPRELVFECMITPEHLSKFWGPTGVHTPLDKIVVDPRPGGAFSTVMVNDATGEEYPSNGVFVEITPPERLVFAESGVADGMTTAITFLDLGDGRTRVLTLQTNVPAMYRSPEADAGMRSSFDRFAAYLADIQARPANMQARPADLQA